MIRTVHATEYVMPLREGGSLPAIVAGDDDGTYVAKFRGAGQGHRALVAEIVSGELARTLGLPVPEIVFTLIDGRMAKTEPDPEIQDLLRKSEGLNLGIDYLPGSIAFDPLVPGAVANDARLASSIVWLDALVTNVDRTPRNTNLLVWHRKLYLIDHGATLIFHHHWTPEFEERSGAAFPGIRDHVLLPWASDIAAVDEELTKKLGDGAIDRVLSLVPDEWLGDDPLFPTPDAHRAAYRTYLKRRLESPRLWVQEAVRVRTSRV